MRRRLIDDEVTDARAGEAPEVPPAREQAALVLGLQRSVGNAAMTRLLQRNGPDTPVAFGGLGSARLRSFATGMPPEEAMLESMPPEMAAMVGEARRREEGWDEDEEQDEADWELPPLIVHEPTAAEPEPATDVPEPAVDVPELASEVPEPAEAAVQPESLPALGELGGARLRSFATGMSPEEAQQERERELKARGAFPRPDAAKEIEAAQTQAQQQREQRGKVPQPDANKGQHGPTGLGSRRWNKLEKAIGHRAAHLGGDPAALAAGLQQGHRTEQQRIADKQVQEQQRLDAREKNRQAQTAYRPVRDEAKTLKAQIDALSEHVVRMLPSDTASKVEGIATAAATTQVAGPRETLKKVSLAVAKAKQDESAYGSLRAKAKQILDRIDKAPAAYKARLDPASRATALKYAEGPPLPSKQEQAIHVELNRARDDVEGRERDWELAKRSRGKLADLKARRVTLGFIDAAADAAIVAADKDDAADDFWALQQSVKPVEEAVQRLSALEADYQTLDKRLTYTRARLGAGALDPMQDATLANGFANRRTVPDPAHALAQLDNLMRAVEKPAADDAFNDPRRSGNYATATAALVPLEAAGVIRLGNFNSAYVTSYDGDGYSVEFSVDGLPDIVIHVHCTKEGVPKDGANTSHWKPKSGKFTPGVSHPISAALRNKLIDRSVLKPRTKMTLTS